MNEWNHRPSKSSISPTKLKWFGKCPYAFKLKYIEKIEPIYPDPDIFKVGFLVHDTIHEYYGIGPSIENINDIVLTTFYRKWDYSLPYGKFADAIDYLKHFIDFETLRRKKEDVFPESELEVEANGYYGILDFYMRPRKTIIDFKTGKKPKERKSYDYQAVVYSSLVPTENIVYFYYLGPNEIIGTKITEDLVTEVTELKNAVVSALNKKEFPSTGTCNYCEFKHCCSKVH